MMSFTPLIFKYLEDKFKEFLDENKDNLEKCEYLIPTVLANGIKDGKFNVTVLNTNSKWVGVTYKEDKESVVNYINKLIDKSLEVGCPMNFKTKEFNKDVLCTIEQDIIILDTIAKIITIIFTTNQALTQTVAHNMYMDLDKIDM